MTLFQQLGFARAAAIAIDATVVRTMIVPCAMAPLGSRSLYLPKWLEWLPSMSIGPGLSARVRR